MNEVSSAIPNMRKSVAVFVDKWVNLTKPTVMPTKAPENIPIKPEDVPMRVKEMIKHRMREIEAS